MLVNKGVFWYFSGIKDYDKESLIWSCLRRVEFDRILCESDSLNDIDCSTLIDLGSGTGKYLDAFSCKFNSKVNVGIDACSNMSKGIDRKGLYAITSDIHNIPVKDSVADIVSCIGCLEFCDYELVLQEALRVLKDNDSGIILFFPRVNIFYYFYKILHFLRGISIKKVDLNKLTEILESNGFQVVKSVEVGLFGYYVSAKRN